MINLKDKTLSIVIILLFICSLFLGLRFLYLDYNLKTEEYNEDVVNFAVELIKGNKNADNIGVSNFSEEIQNSMLEYYNTTFYIQNEEILVDIELDIINSVIADIEEVIEKSTVNGVLDNTLYTQNIQEKISNRYSNSVSNVDDVMLWEYYYDNYDVNNKDVNEFELKDGKLSIMTNDLIFYDGVCRKYYNGFPIEIYRDTLDKLFLSEVRKSEKFQSIEIVYEEDDKKETVYYLKDYLGNDYSFLCKYKSGKIVDIEFK